MKSIKLLPNKTLCSVYIINLLISISIIIIANSLLFSSYLFSYLFSTIYLILTINYLYKCIIFSFKISQTTIIEWINFRLITVVIVYWQFLKFNLKIRKSILLIALYRFSQYYSNQNHILYYTHP